MALNAKTVDKKTRQQKTREQDDDGVIVENGDDDMLQTQDQEQNQNQDQEQDPNATAGQGSNDSQNVDPDATGADSDTGAEDAAGSDDDETDETPVYTKKQVQAIIDRQKKKHEEPDKDELEARLEEAKKQGIEEGKIEQRRQQVAEEYGFSIDVIPSTMKGIDDFETGLKNFQANHRRNVVAMKPAVEKTPLIGGFINLRKNQTNG